MRLDRLLTIHFFSPLIRLFRLLSHVGIPILMYHSVAADVDNDLHPYFRTVTTPEVFKKHMEFLCQSNYKVLTLSDAVRLLHDSSAQLVTRPPIAYESLKSHNLMRPRLVVITFDDGLRDFYTTAFPILERFGFSATVFLTSGCIDKTFFTGQKCLRTEEIRELVAKGIQFGSHTITHPRLKELSWEEIIHELSGSKEMIENIIGSEVTLFSYPFRFPEDDVEFTRKLADVLIEQGYSACVTTAIGSCRYGVEPLFMRRLPVNELDDTEFLQAKLDGAYNWLHKAQFTYKKLGAISRNLTA